MPDIPPALRDDLLTYLFCRSPDRARIFAELLVRNPGVGELLAELEVDDELRARFEMELLLDGANPRKHLSRSTFQMGRLALAIQLDVGEGLSSHGLAEG